MLRDLLKDKGWYDKLENCFTSDYMESLDSYLVKQYSSETIYPPKNQIFSAFNITAFDKVKVLILGQDPYHGPGQAHGLAFSVKAPCKPPPSLKNIFKELKIQSSYGDLSKWAEQGVFLLNTVLTVQAGKAHSHKGKGWEKFTDAVIKLLSAEKERMIFVLWGGPAQKKKALIDASKHTILESSHPSPLSAYRGFLGCRHFELINEQLKETNATPIDWKLFPEPYQPTLL